MLGYPLRCCTHMKNLTPNVLDIYNHKSSFGFGTPKAYSKDGCCKNVPQTEGRKIEPWPKSDPPTPGWHCGCPQTPQPPNYDPYRIRVPEVVVPPLPGSAAKWTGVVAVTGRENEPGNPDLRNQEGFQHGYNQGQYPQEEEEAPKEEGFLDRLKNLFGRGKKDTKGDGGAMMLGGREPHLIYWE